MVHNGILSPLRIVRPVPGLRVRLEQFFDIERPHITLPVLSAPKEIKQTDSASIAPQADLCGRRQYSSKIVAGFNSTRFRTVPVGVVNIIHISLLFFAVNKRRLDLFLRIPEYPGV